MRAIVRVLASGSSANACFVQVGDTRLLVDAGLPIKRLTAALAALDCTPRALDGVLLTHEHSDHIKGLADLRAAAPDVPIHASVGTTAGITRLFGPIVDAPPIVHGEAIQIGMAHVLAFRVEHDAREPVGYRIGAGAFAVGIATDLGDDTPVVRRALADCSALVLEANHDEDLLARGPYPGFLKRRVASRHGHLSNRQAATLIAAVAGPRLEHVVLCHLSEANNSPERAEAAVRLALLRRHAGVRVVAAERHKPGTLMLFDVPAGIPPTIELEPGAGMRQARLF